MKPFLILFAAVFISVRAANAGVETKKPDDIVDLHQVDSSILVDMLYYSDTNFTGHRVPGYDDNVCYLTKTAAEGLKAAQIRVKAEGHKSGRELTLLVRDCYRPQKSVRAFVDWAAKGEPTSVEDVKVKNIFYPDLTRAQLINDNYISPVSGHSRASSIDLTIAQVSAKGTSEALEMGTIVDFFGDKSHTAATGITTEEAKSRHLLIDAMGPLFKNYSKEWWHFVLKTEPYPKTFFDFNVGTAKAAALDRSSSAPNFAVEFSQPELMAELDRNGRSPLSLLAIFRRIHESAGMPVGASDFDQRSLASELSKFSATYGKISEIVTSDIAALIVNLGIDWEKDITQTYVTSAAKTPRGRELRKNGNVTRFFNEKWLASPKGQFLLSGISNRIDRRGFTPGTCGEVRLIYRLGYETEMGNETYASRIPFTVNAVFTYSDDGHGCSQVAQKYKMANSGPPSELARQILSGPLDFANLKFKQIEINLQAARFPSDLENVENRRFAGQAIYLMRIFGLDPKSGKFFAKKLENTPDVEAILKSPEKQKSLNEFISRNLASVDTGVYLMPDDLLADVAISYSTLGSARIANKPFDLLYDEKSAAKLLVGSQKSATYQFISNGKSLLERLNTSTCMGCHQTSSTAGFHFLGQDRIDFGHDPAKIRIALDGNRLVLPFSPHLMNEIPRRVQYVSRLAAGETPNDFRPHPSAPAAEWSATTHAYTAAGDNMPCPLVGEATFGAGATWACDAKRGLTCRSLVKTKTSSITLGQCVPRREQIYSGLSCRENELRDSLVAGASASASTTSVQSLAFNVAAYQDRVTTDDQIYQLTEGKLDSNQLNCRPTRIGVPLGRVTRACKPAEMALKDMRFGPDLPNEMCAVVGGKGFEEMAKGYFNSQRFANGVGRGMLNTCAINRACREDYICQEMPDFLTQSRFGVSQEMIDQFRKNKVGFCTPTYFVYQLRLDGHPNP